MPNAMVIAGNQASQVELSSSVLPGPFCECAQQDLLGFRQVYWTVVYGPKGSLLGGGLSCIVFGAHL